MGKHMILATIRMTIPPRKNNEVLAIFNPVVERCGVDPGCLDCHIYTDLRDKSVLMLEQFWKTEEDLENHMRSNEYRNLLMALELAPKQPEIRFWNISNPRGIETIEKARSQPG